MNWMEFLQYAGLAGTVLTILGFAWKWLKVGELVKRIDWSMLVCILIIGGAGAVVMVAGVKACFRNCTSEGQAKQCVKHNGLRENVVSCLRRLVVTDQISAKRANEIMRKWDKQTAAFKESSNNTAK